MLRILLIAILILCTACAGRKSSKENKELARLHLRVGTGFLAGGNYPQALREFLIAEKLHPKNPYVLNNLGLTYFVRDDHTKALEKIKKAVEIAPAYSDARVNLARIYIHLGDHKSAIDHLTIVNKDLLFRTPEKGWYHLGLAYFSIKQYEAAKSALQKAIGFNRRYCPAFVLFGRTIFEQKMYEAAASSLDKAAAICVKQKFDEPNYYSGLSYLKLGDKEKAKARMNEVISNFPGGNYAEKARSMLQLIR